LPEPELQVAVLTQHGTCFLDLGWPEFRVGAEYDGREPHSSAEQFARDRRRWRGLEAAGWRVLPFSAADLRNPAGVVAEIRAALADSAAGAAAAATTTTAAAPAAKTA
jgi:very-short-patch-repair endonuclease